MQSHFNGLTPAEAERLAVLMEEMAEAQQIIGKILRHGYDSVNPTVPVSEQFTNRELLDKELGHVRCAMEMMCQAHDISLSSMLAFQKRKEGLIGEWLHHQPMDT